MTAIGVRTGGRWDNGQFFYNRAVSNVNITRANNNAGNNADKMYERNGYARGFSGPSSRVSPVLLRSRGSWKARFFTSIFFCNLCAQSWRFYPAPGLPPVQGLTAEPYGTIFVLHEQARLNLVPPGLHFNAVEAQPHHELPPAVWRRWLRL